jgi:hypothetical protein
LRHDTGGAQASGASLGPLLSERRAWHLPTKPNHESHIRKPGHHPHDALDLLLYRQHRAGITMVVLAFYQRSGHLRINHSSTAPRSSPIADRSCLLLHHRDRTRGRPRCRHQSLPYLRCSPYRFLKEQKSSLLDPLGFIGSSSHPRQGIASTTSILWPLPWWFLIRNLHQSEHGSTIFMRPTASCLGNPRDPPIHSPFQPQA